MMPVPVLERSPDVAGNMKMASRRRRREPVTAANSRPAIPLWKHTGTKGLEASSSQTKASKGAFKPDPQSFLEALWDAF